MCGIAGAVATAAAGPNPVAADVERQLRLLDHRGPDSWGVYERDGAVIGQTRLAVIDLVTGDPPIAGEDGTVGVALNGEIYNFQRLREELARDGHRFATAGDTEVIAHLAESCEPVELATRLEGMFAFAVWDNRRRRLVLGRDRVGKKPLYYWAGPGRLVFGSEIKAVLAHPWVPRELDGTALPAYLTFGYVPTPGTFFAGVRSVPPGHVLTLDGAGQELACYWRPEVPNTGDLRPLDLPLAAAAREVRALLTEAVSRRLVADVPLGAFLSGGIDSSAIVGIMAELSPRPVRTFTIGFEEKDGYDERVYARQVAGRFDTDHTEVVVKPNAVDLVERLVWHHDQPFGDASAIPTYLLSELTRRSVTVALCGDGGDELFGGYERFSAALLADRYRRLPAGVRKSSSRLAARLPVGAGRSRLAGVRRFVAQADLDVFDAYQGWLAYLGPEWRGRLLADPSDWAIEAHRAIWSEAGQAGLLDRLLLLNVRTYLVDDLLPKVDRMSMAHALEVRAPFLDRELVEFALRLPPDLRVRGLARKRVLKEAVRGLLPFQVIHRRKRGFGVPLDRWFREDLKSFVGEHLASPAARVRTHLDGAAVDALVGEHDAGQANHGLALWALLTLEVFLRREGW